MYRHPLKANFITSFDGSVHILRGRSFGSISAPMLIIGLISEKRKIERGKEREIERVIDALTAVSGDVLYMFSL